MKSSKKTKDTFKHKPETSPNPPNIRNSKKRRKRKATPGATSQLLKDYPHELRGPPQNRFGGHKTIRIKAFPGSTFGPASPCRKYSRAECVQVERELRAKGCI
jgi:hypothetical protein